MVKIDHITDVRDQITVALKKDDRKLPWLAKQTGYSYAHLYHVLIRKERPLTAENLDIINTVLGTKFKL